MLQIEQRASSSRGLRGAGRRGSAEPGGAIGPEIVRRGTRALRGGAATGPDWPGTSSSSHSPCPPAGQRCAALTAQGGEGGITMESSLDRRRSHGRRRSDGAEALAARGLLHELGHQMTSLSYLVEAVRGDVVLPDDSGFRMELLSVEMSRMLDIVSSEIPDRHEAEEVAAVDLGSLSGQVAQLARFAHEASVVLLPGPAVSVEASPALLWRVPTHVGDNALRAAGPEGPIHGAIPQEQDLVGDPARVVEAAGDRRV